MVTENGIPMARKHVTFNEVRDVKGWVEGQVVVNDYQLLPRYIPKQIRVPAVFGQMPPGFDSLSLQTPLQSNEIKHLAA